MLLFVSLFIYWILLHALFQSFLKFVLAWLVQKWVLLEDEIEKVALINKVELQKFELHYIFLRLKI